MYLGFCFLQLQSIRKIIKILLKNKKARKKQQT